MSITRMRQQIKLMRTRRPAARREPGGESGRQLCVVGTHATVVPPLRRRVEFSGPRRKRDDPADMLRAVERALATLAPEQRAVLTLVAVEGLSYREAAEVLDTPIGTVMSRLARARAALVERLGAVDGGSHG